MEFFCTGLLRSRKLVHLDSTNLAKTKIVLKNVYMCLWRLRVTKQVKTQRGGEFVRYFDSFSPPSGKRSTIKAFPEVSLVSLTLRARKIPQGKTYFKEQQGSLACR